MRELYELSIKIMVTRMVNYFPFSLNLILCCYFTLVTKEFH